MLVFCGSVTKFNPLEGVTVSLLNTEGETLRSAPTDSSGFAIIPFDPEKAGVTPYMLTAQWGTTLPIFFSARPKSK
ncbi:MAG: hypothetical protein IPN19_15245 [Elusimicrobia bacterium]|nr:hypothetical protein [Elusimicrobiota bacterium]